MNLLNKKVAVFGLGLTGLATARFLVKKEARVSVYDHKPKEKLTNEIDALPAGVEFIEGELSEETDIDLVILSPGINFNSENLVAIRNRGVETISEIELGFRFSKTPIIAVSGTNAKSTTVTLIKEILTYAGKDVVMAGNIGIPFISQLENEPKDFWILEVSSFQLEGVKSFHPKIALIINLSPDHLDRHETMENYASIKEKLAVNQTLDDALILNQDDPWVKKMGAGKLAQKIYFSRTEGVPRGLYMRGDTIWCKTEAHDEVFLTMEDLPKSLHWQMENVAAAACVACHLGFCSTMVKNGLAAFEGLPHRFEWVRTKQGVDFINDSKGTNIGALHKSLESINRPVVLIAGGKDKDSDFAPLKDILRGKTKHLVLIGETAKKILSAINSSLSVEVAKDLKDAVMKAWQKTEEGDVVLLSPGCASFDMFRDYEERGEKFKDFVLKL